MNTASQKKIYKGRVVSTKMQKTIIVSTDHLKTHPIYKKKFRAVKNYHVHDAKSDAREGDMVEFMEVAPISRHKKWKLVSVIK